MTPITKHNRRAQNKMKIFRIFFNLEPGLERFKRDPLKFEYMENYPPYYNHERLLLKVLVHASTF